MIENVNCPSLIKQLILVSFHDTGYHGDRLLLRINQAHILLNCLPLHNLGILHQTLYKHTITDIVYHLMCEIWKKKTIREERASLLTWKCVGYFLVWNNKQIYVNHKQTQSIILYVRSWKKKNKPTMGLIAHLKDISAISCMNKQANSEN